jgi:hypothetical protein
MSYYNGVECVLRVDDGPRIVLNVDDVFAGRINTEQARDLAKDLVACADKLDKIYEIIAG